MSRPQPPAAWRRLTAAWLLVLTVVQPAAAGPPPASTSATGPLAERLDAVLAQAPQQVTVGLVVIDCDNGAVLYEHLPDRPLKPASVLKLLTSAAFLERFGSDFCYRTTIGYRAGELIVIGAGDPALGDERIAQRHGRPWLGELSAWAGEIRRRGWEVRRIVLDDSIFEPRLRHEDWPVAENPTWYQAPVGGINYNDNCLDARVRIADGRPVLELFPRLPARFFVDKLRPGKQHAPLLRRAVGQDVFEFTGSVARADRFKPVSAARPSVFFGYALQQALRDAGLSAAEVVRRRGIGHLPADARLLAEVQTSLDDVLWRCNTFSQNLFAECLLKSMAAYHPDGRRSGRAGSWQEGTRLVRSTLAGLGLDLTGAVLRDGSGLSHRNRVTARQVARLLVLMRHHRCAEQFIESLARPGRPGSMRRRYNTPALRQTLRGKTGTISGVKTLAGYIERPDGRVLAFAILGNGGPSTGLITRLADEIAR